MAWNRLDGAPFRARNLLADLDGHGVQLDAPVLNAVENLDRIEAGKPAETDPQALRDAIVDGATPAQLDALVLAELGSHRVRTAYEQARLVAAVRILNAILDDRDSIHEQLAEHAHECIEKLERINALDGAPLDTLIREGRTEDARLVADASITGETLNALYQIRDLALTPADAELRPYGFDVSRWRSPAAVQHGHGTTVAEVLLDGLSRGGRLWFPNVEEQHEALAPLVAEHERSAQAKQDREHGLGYLAV